MKQNVFRLAIGRDANAHTKPAQEKQRIIDQELQCRAACASIKPAEKFDPFHYAQHRQKAPWVTVEVGPGSTPSGIDARLFTGRSRYIGLENFSYGDYSDAASSAFEKLQKQRATENIELVAAPLFGQKPGSRYDLKDGTADEIYVSRVYDKPPDNATCEHRDDEQQMTHEISRLLKPGGHILIADFIHTIVDILQLLRSAGLEPIYVIRDYSQNVETGKITVNEAFSAVQKILDFKHPTDFILIARKPQDQSAPSSVIG